MHQRLIDLHELVMTLCPKIYECLSQKDMLQFFFAYRWLLLEFRREFNLDEVRIVAISYQWVFCSLICGIGSNPIYKRRTHTPTFVVKSLLVLS